MTLAEQAKTAAQEARSLAEMARERAIQAKAERERKAEEERQAKRSAEIAEGLRIIGILKQTIPAAASKGLTAIQAYRWNSYYGHYTSSTIKKWAESEGFTVKEDHTYDENAMCDSSSMVLFWE